MERSGEWALQKNDGAAQYVVCIGNAIRVPENPGNPLVFRPVNPGLCASKNPGLTGLISGDSTHRILTLQLVYSYLQSIASTSVFGIEAEHAFSAAGNILCTKIRSRFSDAMLDTPCKQILLNSWICLHSLLDYKPALVGCPTHLKSLHFHSFYFSTLCFVCSYYRK